MTTGGLHCLSAARLSTAGPATALGACKVTAGEFYAFTANTALKRYTIGFTGLFDARGAAYGVWCASTLGSGVCRASTCHRLFASGLNSPLPGPLAAETL